MFTIKCTHSTFYLSTYWCKIKLLFRSAIYRMANNPPSSEKKIIRKNYAKFCDILKHEDGLLLHLVEKGIISWDDLDEINTAEKEPTLLKHISGPLEINHTQGFYGLLEIMINHGKVDTQEFARKIKYECLSNRGNVKYIICTYVSIAANILINYITIDVYQAFTNMHNCLESILLFKVFSIEPPILLLYKMVVKYIRAVQTYIS